MNIGKAVNKYIEILESDTFARYEKDLSESLTSALSDCYQNSRGEPEMVKIIEKVINNFNKSNVESKQPYFKISTNGIFIHGYPKGSGVVFDYYGKSTHKELGDIIFIVSIIFNGQKYFEKFTINQFKKDKQSRKSISWDIKNKEQLYLLSRFPKFKGVKGSLVPQRDFNLPNYSGCLGSYGLLYSPGDFAFVSATRLDSYLGSSKKINGDDLFLIRERGDLIDVREWRHFWHDWIHMVDLCKHFCGFRRDICCFQYPNPMFMGNCHFAGNIFDFVDKYLRLCIGEPTETKLGRSNRHARDFLNELMFALRRKAERDKLSNVLNFVDGFSKYRYSSNESEDYSRNNNIKIDFGGGGLGIIHTVINLGE